VRFSCHVRYYVYVDRTCRNYIQACSSSESSVNIYQPTRRHIPEGGMHHSRRAALTSNPLRLCSALLCSALLCIQTRLEKLFKDLAVFSFCNTIFRWQSRRQGFQTLIAFKSRPLAASFLSCPIRMPFLCLHKALFQCARLSIALASF
jgi:hypothetical protein